MKAKQSIDDSRGSTDLSFANSDTASPDATSIPENKRRRLVRGAMAVAPLVLTLRSGALAAASCTGARTVNGSAVVKIPSAETDPRKRLIPTEAGAAVNDVCYRANEVALCPTTDAKLENGPGSPRQFALVNGPDPDHLSCGTGDNVWTGNVAILSSQGAATSFLS